MIDFPSSGCLTNARLVLRDRVMRGSVTIEAGLIAAIGPPNAEGVDCAGDFLIPGIVDVHTDHVEKHLFPRAGVVWDAMAALLAHDAQMIGAGTTTVLDSLCVGATMKNQERRQILGPLLDTLDAAVAANLMRADHLVHLRGEISDPATPALVDANFDRTSVRMFSVMDHTPGDRQSPDIKAWTAKMAAQMQIDAAESEARTDALIERSARHAATVRAHVTAAAAARNLPLMSHDDATPRHVDQAASEGVVVSEFPTTLEAAQAAKAAGLAVVAGAPNYLRGGSQSGNIAVRDLLAGGLVDALASDYVPRSMIDAAFRIGDDDSLAITLPQAVAMVTAVPARMARLSDRGSISEGLRADLVRVRPGPTCVTVCAVWRDGRRVL